MTVSPGTSATSASRKGQFVLYGANGYTGRLIAAVALREGMKPVLAGRSKETVESLARELGCDSLVFPLADASVVARHIGPFGALLLAAGPFSATSRVALDACIRARVAYLDITGELDVFEHVFGRHADALAAGIPVLPGTGFDVVPSDCLARALSEALPGATKLELAFRGFKTSAGTMKTMIEGLPSGGRARVDGQLVRVPAAWKTMTVPFSDKPRLAMTIPWGDLATAFRSTGIPNIEVSMAMPRSAIEAARRTRLFAPLLGF
ncbi:MAG: saccharopine dehydrogenase NADP-binding domain-containing protein, partial [Thermoanaerobaculia bacterium]